MVKVLCNDLKSPDWTKADIFPIKGNTKYSCFLGTVKMKGFLMYNLLINYFEIHLSMNMLEYPLYEKYFLKLFNFKVKPRHIRD